MGNQYGPYVMYFLSRMLQKQRQESQAQESTAQGAGNKNAAGVFDEDETGAAWRRQSDPEILKKFCPEGFSQAKKHGHFLIGQRGKENFIAIPGRFLKAEQPACGETGFTLWQPLRGGRALYENLAEMDSELADCLYGYWIARVDGETLVISEV